MKTVCFLVSISLAVATLHATASAAPQAQPHEIATPPIVELVSRPDAPVAPGKAASDTTWIATWTFDGANGCDDTGWVVADNRILNDGNVYWHVSDRFDGFGNIVGDAAEVSLADPCNATCQRGYFDDWHQGICMRYVGDSHLSFDYLVDSESGFDFLQVEIDSACSSFSMVDYDVDPSGNAAAFRDLLWAVSGFDTTTARLDSLALSGYASLDTHCVYISFFSDGAFSCGDGLQPSLLAAGGVVDNILLQGALALTEDFTNFTPSADIQFVNLQDATPFGTWSRLFQNITDNDLCTENPTCAWLTTDHTTPTFASDPSMAFGPGGYVVRNWLDETVTGPWASLASTPNAVRTFIQFRRFPGNTFSTSRLVQNWSVRGRTMEADTSTPAPGDSIECVSAWGHSFQWNSLSTFAWLTSTWDATAHFDPVSRDLQVRLRTSDWQWIAGSAPPGVFNPGPGPYWDRVRIGRQILTGPVIDEGIDGRFQANDAAPNDPNFPAGPMYAQLTGPNDIFGTTAFSRSGDRGTGGSSANLIVGDSITVDVEDVLGNGGLAVETWFAIVEGPHAGKAPAPYTVGANGFFSLTAEMARNSGGQIVADRYFADLDDTYFRGGDMVLYFWWATDQMGGATSLPEGLTALPASVDEAEAATGGLFEVSYLPSINWDPAYLARIQADSHGDLEPTPTEIANSSQAHCILYYENVNSRRRSGDSNRTAFMYTLDRLGYRGHYDVYDLMGLGNTNNQLGARMSPDQARGYSLLIYDSGNRNPGAPILPDGLDLDAQKIDMSAWFQAWNALSGAPNPEHTLWMVASNAVEERSTDALYASMAVSFNAANQAQDVNPDVFGVANFTHHTACVQTHIGDQFALNGGCPIQRDYDDIGATGTGVVTHFYGKGSASSAGATVMHANNSGYSTILSSFAWSDIAAGPAQTPSEPLGKQMLSTILACALPVPCQESPTVTDVDDDAPRTPARTALFANAPNPFNPVTTIRFDLAQAGRVNLTVYDVAGRRVRVLHEGSLPAGFDHRLTWDGNDDRGRRVASGVYFYRLQTAAYEATRKMVVMK